MKNYKLIIQYNGKNYAGWQKQENANTVQGEIENALAVCLREKVSITGSGRTDTGVHALGQTANFRVKNELNKFKIRHSINALTPDDISIISMEEVHENFHSRFDAISRSYLYIVTKHHSPFYNDFAWNNPQLFDYDLNRLNYISKQLLGNHDFTSLSKKNEEQENKFCTLSSLHWSGSSDIIKFYIRGNRFLYGMVRTIAGTLLKAYFEENPGDYLHSILAEKDRAAAAQSVPAKGLFLFKVRYKNDKS